MFLARGAALALFLTLASGASAQMTGGSAARPFPTVTVTGEGSTVAVPDLAYVLSGVSTEAKTPKEASEANAKAMTAVIAAAREAGVAEKDIRTSNFGVYPLYSPRPRENAPQQIVGYRVTNQVELTLRDLSKVSDTLDRLVAAGANVMGGVQFSVSKHDELLDAARKASVADARRKAALYAVAAGVQVGRVLTITEQSVSAPQTRMYRASASGPAVAAATPIAPGEDTLRVQISVTFELMH